MSTLGAILPAYNAARFLTDVIGQIRSLHPEIRILVVDDGSSDGTADTARQAGVTSFEASVAGLGGCPFTAVAGGNTCTEDLVHELQWAGERRDIDLAALIELARDVARFFDRELPGAVYRAGPIPAPGSAEA